MKLKTYLSEYIEPNGKLAWKEPSFLCVCLYYILQHHKSMIYRVLFTPPLLDFINFNRYQYTENY